MDHYDLTVIGPGGPSLDPKVARTGLLPCGGYLPHRCPGLYAIYTNKRGAQRP